MDVNPERRRISLSMKAAAADLGIEIAVENIAEDGKKETEAPEAEATETAAE